jgi:predicted dehydrogenase
MRSLIIGDGYSARSFHLPALERIARQAGGPDDLPLTGVVEPRLDARRVAARPQWLEFFGSLEESREHVADDPVVHICTPPDAHLPALAEAAELGYRRFIIEKPLASDLADAAEIMRLEREHGLQIVVVANWLSSSLTRTVKEEIAAHEARNPVRALNIFSSKPRIARSLFSSSHRSAFDVEVPHFLALALHLCGPGSTLHLATCDDLIVDERRVAAMGSATMLLEAETGYEALIETHLVSPVRERRIAVEFEDGSRLVGHYPCGSPEIFSQVVRVPAGGVPGPPTLLEDDTVYRMISDAYAFFDGEGPRPISDTRLHYAVCALLSDAKASCGMYDADAVLEASGRAA